MKKKRISIVVALLLIAFTVQPKAQTIANVKPLAPAAVTLSTANASCLATNCISLELGGFKTVSVQLVGACSACTVQFEASDDAAGTWVAVNMFPLSGTQTAVTSATAPGVWNGTVPMARFRVRISALTSSTFVVTVRATL